MSWQADTGRKGHMKKNTTENSRFALETQRGSIWQAKINSIHHFLPHSSRIKTDRSIRIWVQLYRMLGKKQMWLFLGRILCWLQNYWVYTVAHWKEEYSNKQDTIHVQMHSGKNNKKWQKEGFTIFFKNIKPLLFKVQNGKGAGLKTIYIVSKYLINGNK